MRLANGDVKPISLYYFRYQFGNPRLSMRTDDYLVNQHSRVDFVTETDIANIS